MFHVSLSTKFHLFILDGYKHQHHLGWEFEYLKGKDQEIQKEKRKNYNLYIYIYIYIYILQSTLLNSRIKWSEPLLKVDSKRRHST